MTYSCEVIHIHRASTRQCGSVGETIWCGRATTSPTGRTCWTEREAATNWEEMNQRCKQQYIGECSHSVHLAHAHQLHTTALTYIHTDNTKYTFYMIHIPQCRHDASHAYRTPSSIRIQKLPPIKHTELIAMSTKPLAPPTEPLVLSRYRQEGWLSPTKRASAAKIN